MRTHPTRRLTAALAVAVVAPTLAVSALVAGASTSAGVAPDTLADVAVAAAPTVQIQPGALPRGENPQVAVMVDDTILDGDVRVPVAEDSRGCSEPPVRTTWSRSSTPSPRTGRRFPRAP